MADPHQTPNAEAGSAANPSASSTSNKLFMERDKKRMALKISNSQIWDKGPNAPKGTLDSNMKKNTGFIKKVRQGLTAEAKAQLSKEAASLNLDKYVEELVQAVPEGVSKCNTAKDSMAAVEMLSELHSRFAPPLFAIPLATAISSALAPASKTAYQSMPAEQKEREEASRVARQKVLIRVAADMAVAELIRSPSRSVKPGESSTGPASESPGQDWLYGILKELLATDREHTNVPILITLLKALGSHLLGPASSDATPAPPSTDSDSAVQLVDPLMASRFRKLCETYYSTLSKRIVKEHNRLQEQDRKNHEAYIRSGEIFEDRQQNYEKMSKSLDRVLEGGKTLSELIGLHMPTLSNASKSTGAGLAINLDSKSSLAADRSEEAFASGKSPWEDEDTRRFYEDLLDLRDVIPPALLGILHSEGTKDSAEDTAAASEEQSQSAAPESGSSSAAVSPTLSHRSLDGKSQSGNKAPSKPSATQEDQLSGSTAAQLTALLARLPEMVSRPLIDSASVEFALINSKAARKRLIKQIAAIPRNRSDLIPYYARLIATLNPYMPDIGKGVLDALDEEFRYLQRKRSTEMAETRAKNAHFMGELTKFKVTPSHTIFHSFKVLLDDFSGPSIDALALLLESCGRYLLRSDEHSERMRALLETLRRKRAMQNLDHRQVLLLDNAYYQCNPPERKAMEVKHRSPMELYIRHLIYDELNARSADKVLKSLRKLHWDDPETLTVLTELFMRVWRIKFSNIHLLSLLISDLQPHQPAFVISIIDAVCEEIRVGMELNLFKRNQRRVAMIQYLGELYVYRVIHSGLVLDMLWSLITFGHPNARALPGQRCRIDPPDDYFRIRLACTLLDVCGVCFDRASLRKKMDEFLVFFNLYILTKELPLPMDVEFMVGDTLDALRPGYDFKKDWSAVAELADGILTAQRERQAKKAAKKAKAAGQQVAAGGVGDQTSAVPSGQVDAVEDHDDDDSSSDEDDGEDDEDEDGEKSAARKRGRRDEDLGREEVASDSDGSATDKGEEQEEQDEDEGDDDLPRRPQQSREELLAEEEFARELAKMSTEVGGSSGASGSGGASSALSSGRVGGGGGNQRNLFDSGLPFIRKSTSSALPEDSTLDATQMRFQLLSKKGNKHQSHNLALPSDSAIATKTRELQTKELAERKQLKEYVLGYEGREEVEDRNALEKSLMQRGFRVRNSKPDPQMIDEKQQRFL
ncbi:unnamed protein product [Sympodiomycopsis kandeliae]